MSHKVSLTLTSRQTDENGEVFSSNSNVYGDFFERNGTFYLLFDEIPEGTGAVVKNTIRLKKNLMELTKRGAVNTRMVFEPGKEYLTDYITPYGCLKLGIFTRTLEVLHTKDLPEIRLNYLLTSEGTPVADCSLALFIHSIS